MGVDAELLLDFVVDMRLANLSPKTIGARMDVLQRLSAHLGSPLLAVTGDQLRAYQARFASLAPASINIYTRHMKAFYAWAVQRGHLEVDPAAELIVPKVRRGRPHPTTPEDVRRIFSCTHGTLRLAYALAAFAGTRCAEICALQRQDVVLHPGEPTALIHGKGDQWRTIPLVPAVVDELRAYGLPRAGYVLSHLGRPLEPHRLSNMSTHYLQRLGIPTTLHSLRHYFLTNAARLTHDPLFVRDLAGHQSVTSTEIYIDTDMNDAHRRLAGVASLAEDLLGLAPQPPEQLRTLDQPA